MNTWNAATPSPVSTTLLQRWMAILAWVLFAFGTIWVGGGHGLMGGGAGWMMVIHVVTVIPAYFLLSLTHAILVTIWSRRVGASRFSASPRASKAAIAVVILTVLYPFFVTDGGDTPESAVPSRLMAWFGVPESVTATLLMPILIMLVVAFIVTIAFDIAALVATRRPKL